MPDGTSTQHPENPDHPQHGHHDQSAAIAHAQQLARPQHRQRGRDDGDTNRTRFKVAIAAPDNLNDSQRLPDRGGLNGQLATLLGCLHHQQPALAYDFAQAGTHLPPRRSRSLASSSSVALNRCGLSRANARTRRVEISANTANPAARRMAARIRLLSQNATRIATATRTTVVNARNSETMVHKNIAVRRATCSSTSVPSSSMRVCAMAASVRSNCLSESNMPSECPCGARDPS